MATVMLVWDVLSANVKEVLRLVLHTLPFTGAKCGFCHWEQMRREGTEDWATALFCKANSDRTTFQSLMIQYRII